MLSHGLEYLAIPGPSVIPNRVLQAMHQPSPNIYAGHLGDVIKTVKKDLNTIAGSSGDVALYASNGHGVWEAALANIVMPGETVLFLATGQFAFHWAILARSLGIDAKIITFGNRATIDLDKVRDVLTRDSNHKIKAICVPHVDTATSVLNDINALRQTINELNHPALLCVDIIASLGNDRFEMDNWGVDVAVAACQKGLMTPAGLAFLFFGQKGAAARTQLNQVSAYWDWNIRASTDQIYASFFGTPPTQHLFGLRTALDMILYEEGLETVLYRHKVLAQTIWAALDAWRHPKGLRMTLPNSDIRSHAVTSIEAGSQNGARLQNWTTQNVGLTLGCGLGMAGDSDPECRDYFRIGHMGHVNGHMIMGALGAIDAGLKALDIPHAQGALDAAASVIAKATKYPNFVAHGNGHVHR